MKINTKVFGEVEIADDKIIHFPSGIVGFPELTEFTLLHDEEKGAGSIHWLQSIQEPGFAMPEVDDELLKPLGGLDPEEILVLVTVTVPSDLKKMSVNLRGPIIINAAAKKACQVIVEGEGYQVKYPIYEILSARKAGE